MRLSLHIFARVLGSVVLTGLTLRAANGGFRPLVLSGGLGALQLLIAIVVLFALFFSARHKARRHGHAAQLNFFLSICSFWTLVALLASWIVKGYSDGLGALDVFKVSLASLLAVLVFLSTWSSLQPRGLRSYAELFVTCTTSLSMMAGVSYLLCKGTEEGSLALWVFRIVTMTVVSLLAFEVFWQQTGSAPEQNDLAEQAVETTPVDEPREDSPRILTP